ARPPRAGEQRMCHGAPHPCGVREAGARVRFSQRRTKRRSGKLWCPWGACARRALTCVRAAPIVMVVPAESSAPAVILTPRAVEKVRELRTREGRPETSALRVAVVGGGCSGFSYQLDFDDESREGDQVLEYDGVRVLVDPTSAEHLAGTEIDFVASLHGGGFKFANPKATHTC